MQENHVSRTYYVTHTEQQDRKEHVVPQEEYSASTSQTEKGHNRLYILTRSMGSVRKGKNDEQNTERHHFRCQGINTYYGTSLLKYHKGCSSTGELQKPPAEARLE